MEAGDKEEEELVADAGTRTWGHGLHSDAETQMVYHKFSQKCERVLLCGLLWNLMPLPLEDKTTLTYLFRLLT